MLWLGAATAVLTVLGALVFWALGISWGDRSGPAESLWRSFVIAIGKGVIGDATWTQRFATLFFIFASLFLAGSLVGLLVSAISRRLDDIRRGRSRVVENSHTLVLGASERLLPVIDELLANESDSAAIVVLAQRDKLELEDDLLARHAKPSRRVVFRTGSPIRRADLDLVGLAHARSVIVLNDGSSVDAVTVRRALAANAFSPDDVHVVAEMSNQRVARSLRESTQGRVAPVGIDATVADMLTQAIRSPGLAGVFDRLLSFEGAEFYVEPAGELAGMAWREVNAAIRASLPVAIVDPAHNTVELLPANDRQLSQHEQLVVLSEKRNLGRTDAPAAAIATGASLTDASPQIDRVMVLGWSRIGALMLHELDGFLGTAANVNVLADESMIPGGFPTQGSYQHRVAFRHTKHDPDEIRAIIDEDRPDVLVVLGYLERLGEDEADALTLLTLHTIANAPLHHHRPRIVAQMLNNEVGNLARTGDADDFVVTDALVSRMLVHLARERTLAPVFDDLFDAQGPSARLITVTPGTYRYDDLRSLVLERHMCLLGVVTSSGIDLNPDAERSVTLGPSDRLVVLGRFGANR